MQYKQQSRSNSFTFQQLGHILAFGMPGLVDRNFHDKIQKQFQVGDGSCACTFLRRSARECVCRGGRDGDAEHQRPGTHPQLHLEIVGHAHEIDGRLFHRGGSETGAKFGAVSSRGVAGFPPRWGEMQRRCHVQVKALPEKIVGPGQLDTSKLDPPGLLYLEHKYVVPGGRFNEMYGWDSYFIVRGLVREGRLELAKGMIENFFFEIEHYGTVLNANRSYYLSRSQPPFLTSMILAVYDAQKAKGNDDKKWLERAYGYAAKDWEMWTKAPHLAGDTGLARYYDFGDVPAPESLKDETDHYRKVAAYFLNHPEQDRGYLVRRPADVKDTSRDTVGRIYSVQICDAGTGTEKAGCDEAEEITLSRDFYRGDRSMRESGFDVSFRFGPHGAATHHFAAVCLRTVCCSSVKRIWKKSAARWAMAKMPRNGKNARNNEKKTSRNICGTRRADSFSITTSSTSNARLTNTSRRSIRCGPGWLRRNRRQR